MILRGSQKDVMVNVLVKLKVNVSVSVSIHGRITISTNILETLQIPVKQAIAM